MDHVMSFCCFCRLISVSFADIRLLPILAGNRNIELEMQSTPSADRSSQFPRSGQTCHLKQACILAVRRK